MSRCPRASAKSTCRRQAAYHEGDTSTELDSDSTVGILDKDLREGVDVLVMLVQGTNGSLLLVELDRGAKLLYRFG